MNAHRIMFGIIVILALVMAPGQPVQAAPPQPNPEVFGPLVAIDTRPGPQKYPAVDWGCPGLGGRFFTVYENQTGATNDIAGRLTDDTGTMADPAGPFPVVMAAGDQRRPAVAQNIAAGAPGGPGNSFMVVWMSLVGGGWDIYAQVWGCNKMPLSPPVLVSGPDGDALMVNNDINPDSDVIPIPPNSDMNPDVVCGTLVCWVVWETNRSGDWNIVGQRVDGAANLVGGNVALTTNPAPQQAVAIDYNPQNGCAVPDSFLAVWHDGRNAGMGNGWDIFARQLDSVGPCTGEMATYAGPGNQMEPDLAYGNVAGLYQVAWQDNSAGGWDIFGEVANPNGAAAGAALALAAGAGTETRPAVAYNPVLNRFLTGWQGNGTGDYNVYGQLTNGGGGLIGANFLVPPAVPFQEQNAVVAFSPFSLRFYINLDVQLQNILGIAYW